MPDTLNTTNNPREMTFYLAGGIIVKPVAYDRQSGEVSYLLNSTNQIYTCLISDLGCVNGFEVMMEYLNNLGNRVLKHTT